MWKIDTVVGLGIALALVVLYLLSCIRVLSEYERGVIFRLGHAMPKAKGPGEVVMNEYGFAVDNVCRHVGTLLQRGKASDDAERWNGRQ
jgi:regulator of protease activity HflC (stomatin/prohibitin superfamily)